MPLHDWTRLDDGLFHDFHLAWIAELRRVLNGGLLPDGYDALTEQVAGGGNPDVLALHAEPDDDAIPGSGGGTALLTAPPRTRVVAHADRERYTALQRRMVIRHVTGDRIVAMIEIVSAGNKASEHAWQAVVNKSLAALSRGIHLLILDLHPPTPRDPDGVHGAVWGALTGQDYSLPPEADRTLVAYSAGPVKAAYAEPVAVGQPLRDMPLFLTPDGIGHIDVPLDATYSAAYEGVPRRYRRQLD